MVIAEITHQLFTACGWERDGVVMTTRVTCLIEFVLLMWAVAPGYLIGQFFVSLLPAEWSFELWP